MAICGKKDIPLFGYQSKTCLLSLEIFQITYRTVLASHIFLPSSSKTPKKNIHICPGSNLKFIWKMLFDEVDLWTHLIFLAQHHICFIQDQGFYIPTIDDLLLRQILEEAWFFYVKNEPVEALGCYKQLQAATF